MSRCSSRSGGCFGSCSTGTKDRNNKLNPHRMYVAHLLPINDKPITGTPIFSRKHFTTKQESANIIAFFTEHYANYADGIPGVWETVPAHAMVIPCLAETLRPLPVTACAAWRNAGSQFAAGGWFCVARKPYRCIFVCLFLVYIRCSLCGSNGYFFI